MPLSRTEKREVSMLDCREEHIPIKKRRFMLRSSSPPLALPAISPQPTIESTSLAKSFDASNKLAVAESASDFNSSKNTAVVCMKFEKNNKSFGAVEDFSGISLLAAAACSSSLGRYCGYVESGSGVESSAQGQACDVSAIAEAPSSARELMKEDLVNTLEMSTGATSSCVSTERVGELSSTLTSVNEVTPLVLSKDVSCNMGEEIEGMQKTRLQDDRLHWDLNVVMDAWEQPYDSPEDNVIPDNISQEARKDYQAYSIEYLGGGGELRDKLTAKCAAKIIQHGEFITFANQNSRDDKKNNHNSYCESESQPLLSNCSRNLDIVKSAGEVPKSLCYNTTMKSTEKLVDFTPCPSAYENNGENDDVSQQSTKLNGEGHLKERPTLEGLNINSNGSDSGLENCRNAYALNDMQSSVSVSSCSDIPMEVIPNLANLGNVKTCPELQFDEPLEHLLVASDGTSLLHPFEFGKAPSAVSTKCEFPVSLDIKVQGVGYAEGEPLVCSNVATETVSAISRLSEETCDSVNHETPKAKLTDCCSDKIDTSTVEQNVIGANVCRHPLSSVGNGLMVEIQEDFDSQYEDGEFRELDKHPWEGYDGVDREADHVEYDYDYTETCTPVNYHVSESGQVNGREIQGTGFAAAVSSSAFNVDEVAGESTKSIVADGDHGHNNEVTLNYVSEEKTKPSELMELLDGRSTSSDMDIALSDDNGGKDMSVIPETSVESRAFKRGVLSRIQYPVAHDTSFQERRLNTIENSYEKSSSMKYVDKGQYSFQNQARGRQSDTWHTFRGNHRRGFRRHYSPIIHRRANLDHDAIMEGDDTGYVGVHDDGSYSCQLDPRNRSGDDEDAYTGVRSRYKRNRAFSPDRPSSFGRGRSIKYGSFVDDREGRERFNGPSVDKSFQSSFNYRRPLAHRERSFSPFGGRSHSNAHHSHVKSPSQSRSRSPIMWDSPKMRLGAGCGRNTFVRQSRSPNFSSEMRMERLRSAHHHSDFRPDHRRSHGPPPHDRWNSAVNEEMGQSREFGYKERTSVFERSPGRIRLKGNRACVLDSPRVIKPDGYYKISENPADRGPQYEENYDGRRKHYGLLRPARHSYEDGITGRLQPDIDDSFLVGKGIPGRDSSDFQGRVLSGLEHRINDFPRRFRDSSRNLKSLEEYRSSRGRRFNGVNRGGQYVNFQDKKLYDSASHIRCCDTEDSEKMLNHNLDENFEGKPNFCGRGMRSLGNRVGGLSTRSREDKDAAMCGQEIKPEDNQK